MSDAGMNCHLCFKKHNRVDHVIPSAADAAPVQRRVAKLLPHEGYGSLETPDQLEVYFHENSVVAAAFSDLDVGTKVRFVLAEGEGEAGPQGSTVEVLG